MPEGSRLRLAIGGRESLDEAAKDQVLDPRDALNALNEVVYDWDISSDRLTWGPNVAEVLRGVVGAVPTSGAAYQALIDPRAPSSRFDVVFGSHEKDVGHGVKFATVYILDGRGEAELSRPVRIEDRGRWFAGRDDRPGRVHGVIRINRLDETEAEGDRNELGVARKVVQLSRSSLIDALDPLIEYAHRKGQPVAMLLVRVDNGAALARTYGYALLEEIAAATGELLRVNVRSTDLIVRFADDRFAIGLKRCGLSQAGAAARRMLAIADQVPLITSAGRIDLSICVGTAVVSASVRDAAMLLQNAEQALDLACERTSGRYVAYERDPSGDALRQQSREAGLQITAALEQRRIVLALQPIVEAKSRVLVGHEALIRMRREDGGIGYPALILPVAERIGLVQRLDRRVLDLALRHLAADTTARLSVNASSASIHDADWRKTVVDVLLRHPAEAARLTMEITETLVISDLAATQALIDSVKACGVRVAMDDFGAGHTSFRNLRHLGIDVLKLDGAFIQNLTRSTADGFFVRTLIDLAGHLGIETVAEWVEDEATASILAEWGVTYLQGHLFGKAELDTL